MPHVIAGSCCRHKAPCAPTACILKGRGCPPVSYRELVVHSSTALAIPAVQDFHNKHKAGGWLRWQL